MVLAGLVISVGVVVDDAIIDIENIVRRLRQHRLAGSNRSTASIILDSSLEVRSAIIYATLIDVVAIIPVFFIEGLSGAFFQPLVISYGLAVLASLVVALTVTPAMALILLRNAPVERRGSPIAPAASSAATSALLSRIVRRPGRPSSRSARSASSASSSSPQLGQSLLPDFKERDFLMHWVTAPGHLACPRRPGSRPLRASSCGRSRASATAARTSARRFQADEVVGIDFGENWISVDPAVDYDDDARRDPGSRRRLSRACGATSRRTSRSGSARS